MTARLLAAAVSLFLLGVLDAGRTASPAPPPRSLAGDLLVATPEMRDPRFARAVIYMVRHDPSGAHGFVLNRPLREVPLARLLEQMQMDARGVTASARLHAGGPVEPRRVFVLHTADYAGEGTEVVKDGVAVTAEPGILAAMAAGRGPRSSRLLLGYAGWAPGQLEAEIEAGAWIRAGADTGLLFDDDYDGKWERAQARQKIDL